MRDRSSRGAIGAVMTLLLVAAMAWPGLPSPALAEEMEGEANPSAQELAVVDQAEPEAEGAGAEADGLESKAVEGEAADLEATPAAEATVAEDEGQTEAVAVDEGQAVSASEEEKQMEPSTEEEQAESAAGEQQSDGDPEEGLEEDSEDLALTAQGVYVAASGTWGTCPWTLDSSGNMTVGPGEGENNGSDNPWRKYGKTKKVSFASGMVLPSDCSSLFSGCSNITEIDLSGCDTSKVTNMSCMFYECSALKSVSVAGWDTSKVTTMREMFRGCSSLTSFSAPNWNTSRVTNMFAMFSECGLLSIDASGWDTSQVRTMHSMFGGCWNLASFSAPDWDTSRVTNMRYMFGGCPKLKSVNAAGWDTSKVADMSRMFCYCHDLVSVYVAGWDTSAVTDMSYMFYHCYELASLDVSKWDTSRVTDMHGLFWSCNSLKSLDVAAWDTSAVTDMSDMFDCWSLESLNVAGWDTSEVTDMSNMFGCPVKKITVGRKFDVSQDFPMGYLSWEWGTGSSWMSERDSRVYTREEIMSSRNGIADTYYARASLRIVSIASVGTQPYTGKEVKPALKVTYGERTLSEGTDYTVTYKNNVKEGQATVTIKGKGYFVDSRTLSFTIKRLKPTWSGATRMPVSSTADYKVTNGGWIRVKANGKWATSDSVVSLSAPSATTKRVTAKKTGTTTLYLFDATGKQVATRKVTVFSIDGKTYEFESSVNKDYVLDIQGGSTKNGAQMIVYKRNNGANQKYQTYLQKDGTYAIRSLKSKKWLTLECGEYQWPMDKYVKQWSWKGSKKYLWRLTVDASNRVTFVNAYNNRCFDVQGGRTTNSAKMIVWQSNGGLNQKWKLNQK